MAQLIPRRSIWLALSLLLLSCAADAGGGPLGMDRRVEHDDSGIYRRDHQLDLLRLMFAGEVLGALWEGGETRLGGTFWRALDATAVAAVSAEAMKRAFSRARPEVTDDPDRFFEGGENDSFPSAEVAVVTSMVTPFLLEYGDDQPWVYALELLPLYYMVARVKVQDHWQSDVLAGFALGTLAGIYAHGRERPFILQALPDGLAVGIKRSF